MDSSSVLSRFEDLAVRYSGGEYRDEEFGYRLLRPEKFETGETLSARAVSARAGERGADNAVQIKYLPQWMAEDRQSHAVSVLPDRAAMPAGSVVGRDAARVRSRRAAAAARAADAGGDQHSRERARRVPGRPSSGSI